MRALVVGLIVALSGCWVGKTPATPVAPQAPVAPAADRANAANIAVAEHAPMFADARGEANADGPRESVKPSIATAEPSYRTVTIVNDVVGVAALTVGLEGLFHGGNETASGVLLVVGSAMAGLGDPLIHLAYGHGGRAIASYLIRGATTSVGLMAGMAAENCRDHAELFCGLEGSLWGMTAGLAVAGVADALILHGFGSQMWTPTVSPSDGGARVGIAGGF